MVKKANNRSWIYTGYEYQKRRIKACCYDCLLPYTDDAWIDALVSDEIWERINPSPYKGGGLLCLNCMCRRFVQAGMMQVQISIRSGPAIFTTAKHMYPKEEKEENITNK